MPRVQGAVAKRAAWSFSAQAISSASSFLLTVGILAVAGSREFATFSVGITTYLLVSQLARSASAMPLMILYSGSGERGTREEHQAAVGVAVAIGLVSALVLLATAGAMSAGREQLFILGVAMPFLLFQDSARYLSFARAQPQVATLSDGIWLTLQTAGFLAAWWAGWATVPVLLGIWCAAGTAAGLVVGTRLGLAPAISGSIAWLRVHGALCRKLVVEFLVNSGSFYLLNYGLVILAGTLELGRLRAAQTLIGPVIVILLAGNSLGVPESVRVKRDGRRLTRLCLVLSASLAGAALAWGLAVYAVLPEIGPRYFAGSWSTARPLIPPLTIFAIAVGVSIGPSSGLRALGQNAWILKARAVTGGISLIVGLPLSGVIGAQGVLAALAGTETLFAVVAWVHLVRSSAIGPSEAGEELEAFVPL
jgi:O-antigen/teichoic acid export membrane protein